jgi:hypothetical protein
MTRYAVLLSIMAGAGVLTYGLVIHGFVTQGIIVALLGVAWLVLHLRRNTRFTDVAFILFGLVSAGVVWAGVNHWLALAGMIFSLLAWDLIAFETRLEKISNREDAARMTWAHFIRLGLVIGLGVGGVIIAGVIKVNLTLGSALLLAIVGIWGISTLVYRLRSRE